MKKFLKDAEVLIATLEETHPNLAFRCPRRRYFCARTKFLNAVSRGLGKADFLLAVREFLHVIHDGHTSVQTPIGFNRKRLQFETVLVAGRLFINKLLADSPGISEKAEIVAVDGEPVSRYFNRMLGYMSYEVRARALLSAAVNFPDAASHVTGRKLPAFAQLRLPDGKCIVTRLVWKTMTPRPGGPPARPAKFHYMPELSAGYLDWKSFVDRRTYDFYCRRGVADKNKKVRACLPVWEDFLDDMFGELIHKKARALIIDLRRNSGGNSALGDNLLEYLERRPISKFGGCIRMSPLLLQQYGDRFGKLAATHRPGSRVSDKMMDAELKIDPLSELFKMKNKPKYKFGGDIVLLTDPGTYSAAETFAALVKDNHLGILIGEPTGNGVNGPIDSLRFKLPESGLSINVSYLFRYRPDIAKRHLRQLRPDICVKQTVEDFLHGKDTVLEFVSRLVARGPCPTPAGSRVLCARIVR